jgi:hypothetical protein
MVGWRYQVARSNTQEEATQMESELLEEVLRPLRVGHSTSSTAGAAEVRGRVRVRVMGAELGLCKPV